MNEILKKYNEIIIKKNHFYNKNGFDWEQHLIHINELRIYFSKIYNSNILVENAINNVLGTFIPSQNTLNKVWTSNDKYEKLLCLSLLSYYIKKDKNRTNIQWESESKYGKLKMSINNAKPEKTLEEIANKNKENYNSSDDLKDKAEPKCPLCIENINFKGSYVKDSRENLRVIFTNLNKNKWFFQYSPYVYLKNHFILSNSKHTSMIISNDTIKELVDFVNENNNYFLGSNSDLEIIGGSLLSHNHYQGGIGKLPIMNAEIMRSFIFKKTKIDVLKWPLNVIKISDVNKNKLINITNYFINSWKTFNKNNLKSINNSVTIIVNKINDLFNVYLIFRNNSTSLEKPFGNYHINPSRFNIKQENIGLMEAAGLAILPKRLSHEINEIVRITNEEKNDNILNYPNLIKHHLWINELIKNNIKITKENLLESISSIFINCLEDCKVLEDEEFIEFIEEKIISNQETYQIENNSNMKIEILPKGFTIKQIEIKGEKMLLEFKNVNHYFENNDIFLNSFVGPVAGRIQNGFIKLGSKEFFLKTDKSQNYIHGMDEKWSDLIYEIEIIAFKKFTLIKANSFQYNKELKCNYNINITLEISNDKNLLNFSYLILANKDTICNPTQHFYWKLPFVNDIFDLDINLKSESFWLLNKNLNPIKKMKWDNNDLINLKKIKKEIGDEQSKLVGNGIDHPIELINPEIILTSPNSNISIVMNSSLNNIVLYTNNWISKNELLNSIKNFHQAVCIEYQEIPTSKENPNFDKITIKKNELYSQNISYNFIIKK